VAELEQIAQEVDLAVAPRARRHVIDLLQEDQVRRVVGDDRSHPLRVVAPIQPADALVHVPGEHTQTHASEI
jgi:hypothetical protein